MIDRHSILQRFANQRTMMELLRKNKYAQILIQPSSQGGVNDFVNYSKPYQGLLSKLDRLQDNVKVAGWLNMEDVGYLTKEEAQAAERNTREEGLF